MREVIVIVTKNGVKYQLGLDKSVNEVLNEVSACKSEFYCPVDTCAIKVDEISSVEQFELPISDEGDGEMIKLEISTHSGDNDTVEVDEYDVEDIMDKLNDNDVQAINFGENIYSRIDIKNIKVIESE